MNFNLLPFVRDIGDVLRLRYHEIDHYRYGLPVFVMIMLAVGMANAVMMRPILGNSAGAMAFALVFAILKWLLLTRATTAVLHYFGSPRIPFLGYALLTEALILPVLLLPTLPEMALFVSVWNMWVFWAQLLGFAKISQQSVGRVLLAYVVYGLMTLIFGMIFLQLFVQAGWLDWDILEKNMANFLSQSPQERRGF